MQVLQKVHGNVELKMSILLQKKKKLKSKWFLLICTCQEVFEDT